MGAPKLQRSGHSADVRIHLCVNGHVLPVAQLGPDFLVLKNTVAHPPTEAEIAMSIDGHEARWQVRLVDGLIAGQRKTRISRCG
jgi:hypothetical protein